MSRDAEDREKRFAKLRARGLGRIRFKCECGVCNKCIRRAPGYLPRKRNSETYGAQKTQRYRERRLRFGVNEYWMIGYDGPSPTPRSAWSLIAEHARLYGFKGR